MAIGGAYVLPVYRGNTKHTVLVLNGIKDYRLAPTPETLATVNMGGLTFGEKVTIAQVGKPVGRKGRSAIAAIRSALATSDSVILWARDTRIYESIRDE